MKNLSITTPLDHPHHGVRLIIIAMVVTVVLLVIFHAWLHRRYWSDFT